MIQIPFYTIAERLPEHQQEIIWLHRRSVFGLYEFEPKNITAECSWYHEETGTQADFNPETESHFDRQEDGWAFRLILDGYFAEPKDLWCPADEYFAVFEGALEDQLCSE